MPIPMFAWRPARRGASAATPQAVKLLAETLRSDVDADVRLAAAKALGETKNPEAVAALGEALNDSDPGHAVSGRLVAASRSPARTWATT